MSDLEMSNVETPKYFVRSMMIEDREKLIEIGIDANLMFSINDLTALLKMDPNGVIVAEEFETRNLLGMCIGAVLSPSFAFIGAYTVLTKYHGKGIGKSIWAKVMQHIGNDRNIGLCFPSQKMFPVYRDVLGFVHIPKRRFMRHKGVPKCDNLIKHIDNITIKNVDENIFSKIAEYDHSIYDGVKRDEYLREHLNIAEFAFIVAINEINDEVKGYCIMVKSVFNTAIPQPLYADNSQIAELLMAKGCEMMQNQVNNGIYLRSYDDNQNATDLAIKMGLNFASDESIMFTKEIIDCDWKRVYYLNSPGIFHY